MVINLFCQRDKEIMNKKKEVISEPQCLITPMNNTIRHVLHLNWFSINQLYCVLDSSDHCGPVERFILAE